MINPKNIFPGPKLVRFYLFILGLLFLIPSMMKAQEKSVEHEAVMKSYYFVLLTKGEKRDQDSATAAQIQKGHLENIARLAEEGKIDIAGPFLDDTNWRGIFVFNVDTEAEVKALLDSDPAIKAGRLGYIIHPWYSRKGSVLR